MALRVGIETELAELEPGAVLDLGDQTLVAGVVIEGRVVDPNGQPIAERSLVIEATATAPTGTIFARTARAHVFLSEKDGSIPRSEPMLPGSYRVMLHEKDLRPVEPKTLVLTLERPVEFVTIVVPASDGPRIRGRVVAEDGAPVADAEVDARDQRNGDRVSAKTERDGSFVLVGRDN
ncbi:MAG: carboxypeptidase-like regulatory domain-containing protein, partial [Rhodoglobus sp.]